MTFKERLQSVIDDHCDGNQAKLVRITGLNKSPINKVLNGTQDYLGAEYLVRIREKFNISLDWLLTGQGSPESTQKGDRGILGNVKGGLDNIDISTLESQDTRTFDELPEEGKALLLKVLMEDREDHRKRIEILENYIEHLRGLLDDNQIKYVPLLHRSGTEG